MKCFPYVLSVVVAAVVTTGCGTHDPPESPAQLAAPIQAVDTASTAGERESLLALKELGANVALDEQGRARVIRLTGPHVTDADLKHVAVLTNLRGLYLEHTKVTDAGMAHLKSLTKLEILHCVTVTGAPQMQAMDAVKTPTELGFIECPLIDVMDTLADLHGIPFKLDEEALEAAGIPSDTPITAEHRQVPLGEALAAILQPLELVWTIDSGNVVATSEQSFAERHPNLTALRQAAPGLKDVLVDW